MEHCGISHVHQPTMFYKEDDQNRQKIWKRNIPRTTYPETFCGIPDFLKKRFSHEQQQRKWFTLVDLEGLRARQVTAKVNPKCHVLLIKVKQPQPQLEKTFSKTLPQHRQQTDLDAKLVRVISLPDNIRLEKLRVEILPRGERLCLLVKAPFTVVGEEGVQQQGRFLPTWIPIRVSVKDNVEKEEEGQNQRHFTNKNFFGGRMSLSQCPLGRGISSFDDISSRKQDAIFFVPSKYRMEEDDLLKASRSRKSWKKMQGEESVFNGCSSPLKISEIIRDEETGKPAMLVKVNTSGFRPEEIRVRVDESERVLIVEASRRCHKLETETEQMGGLAVKYLRREFVLPQWLDVTRTSFRVVKSGLLLIKLPVVKQNKTLQLQHNINWSPASFHANCEEKKYWETRQNKDLKKREWKMPLRA